MTNVIVRAVTLGCIAWLARIRGTDTKRLNWLEQTRAEIDTDGPGFVIYGGDEERDRRGYAG